MDTMNTIFLHIDHLELQGFSENAQREYVQGLQQGFQAILERPESLNLLRSAGHLNQLTINAVKQKGNIKQQGFSTAGQIVKGLQQRKGAHTK